MFVLFYFKFTSICLNLIAYYPVNLVVHWKPTYNLS